MTAAEADHMNLTEVRGWVYSELFNGAPDAVFPAHQLRQLLHRSRRGDSFQPRFRASFARERGFERKPARLKGKGPYRPAVFANRTTAAMHPATMAPATAKTATMFTARTGVPGSA